MFIPHSFDRLVRPVPSPTTPIHTLQVRNQPGGGLLSPTSNDCALRASPAQRSPPLPTHLPQCNQITRAAGPMKLSLWLAVAAVAVAAFPSGAAAQQNFTLPPLPYETDVFEPSIDNMTMSFHWTRCVAERV